MKWGALITVLLTVRGAATAATSLRASSKNPFPNPLLGSASKVVSQHSPTSFDVDSSLSNCKPTGQISDAVCNYETVEKDINSSNFFQTLSTLVQEKYFRYYKVDLYKDCPFWNENSLCMSRDCTVSKVDEFQIPVEYREACLSSLKTTDEADVMPSDKVEAVSNPHSHESSTNPQASSPLEPDTCQCAETDFCHWEDEDWSPESLWVDLIDNPERYTGYSGPSAHKVWRSIYEENCFGTARSNPQRDQTLGNLRMPSNALEANSLEKPRLAAGAFASLLNKQSTPIDSIDSSSEQCLEKRVFYKIISGLHASISIHICHDYLDIKTGEWKPNLECFVERIAQHPERLQNVYFNHVILTRAMAKLAERLGMKSSKDGRMSTDEKDGLLARLAPGLPPSSINASLGTLLQQSLDSPPTFDEASMFDKTNPESETLQREFRDRFRNVSRIMDCVGCDKCRLWGKLQVNGMGTALKILFEGSQLKQDRLLQRSELVAFINTVHRVSESIRAVESFRSLHEKALSTNAASLSNSASKEVTDVPFANTTTTSRVTTSNRRGTSPNQIAASSRSLGDLLLESMRMVVDRGRSACESRWEKCLSWFVTIFNSSAHHGSSKSEL
ncbi:hypothetical protein CBS101457_003531 [Exobasidium rhododendri]|nr:hypothetical protein CBS101457_003531 [Exobasidium rhododendri]